jgi:hypothetical protein
MCAYAITFSKETSASPLKSKAFARLNELIIAYDQTTNIAHKR